MVTQDWVVVWVWVFASGIWGITLEGCVVGAGSAWCWRGVTAAWVIGGFAVIAGHRAGWPCHLCVTRNFVNAGFTDGGAHVWGWRLTMSEWGADDHSLGNFLLTSCSHHWGGSSGEA